MSHKNVGVMMVILFFCLATAVNVINPIFEAPDELEHYQFVRYLIDERALPVQELDGPESQSHQPPLYYLLGALLTAGVDQTVNPDVPPANPHWTSYRPGLVHNDNKIRHLPRPIDRFPYQGVALSMHFLRFMSTVLATVAVGFVWQIGQALLPKEEWGWSAVLLTAVVAFNPMFVYISGSLNNDSLIVLLVTLHIWLVARALQDGYRWQTCVWLGITWGLALLTKLPGLFACALWGLGLLWVCADQERWWDWRLFRWRFLFGRCVLITVIFLLLTGWWFGRNIAVYGEPLALERVIAVWGARQPDQYTVSHITADLRHSWQNFWGRFSYGQVVLPDWFYLFFGLVTGGAALGIVWRLLGKRPLATGSRSWRGGLWLALSVGWPIYVAALLYYIYRNPTGGNGRYTYPVLIGFGALFAYGWSAVPTRWRDRVAVALSCAFLGMSVYSIGFLRWTYSPPQQMLSTNDPQEWTWDGGQIRLLGTALNERVFYEDDDIALTACWVGEGVIGKDYTFFLNGVDGAFNKYVDRNTQMGLGKYPTSQWAVGEPFCEVYRLPVLTTWTERPLVIPLRIGFYDIADGTPLLAEAPEGYEVDFVTVGEVKIVPEQITPPPVPSQQMKADFAQGLSLVGYELRPEGEGTAVSLWWEASQPLDGNYTVFVHLVDAAGEIVAQSDLPPQTAQGIYPTSFWGAGETVVTEQFLPRPLSAVEIGELSLIVGLYRPSDFGRLSLLEPASRFPDAAELSFSE